MGSSKHILNTSTGATASNSNPIGSHTGRSVAGNPARPADHRRRNWACPESVLAQELWQWAH
jgi:hypothetical protein